MYDNITAGMRGIRRILQQKLTEDDSVVYKLGETDDAGPAGRGDLSRQNKPWFVLDTVIDDVARAGPGQTSPVRVWGGIDMVYLTKDWLDDLGSAGRLEEAGSWLAGRTIDGIRFREFRPTTTGRMFGFNSYAGTIALEFEIKPTGA